MIKRTTKLAAKIALALGLVLVVALAALYWRLSRGPVSLDFVKAPFERLINSHIDDVTVRVRDAVIEKAEGRHAIRFRLRGLQLLDDRGRVLARAPRAAIGLSTRALLGGAVVPSRLELIGPHLTLSRGRDGEVELGFSRETNDDAPEAAADAEAALAADQDTASARKVVDAILAAFADPRADDGSAAFLELIAVRDAVISLYDESNRSRWFAPSANLNFQRTADGLSLTGDMTIASGQLPWQMRLDAKYARSSDTFSLVAQVTDLVPAEISGKLSVLANLAEVRTPLSGRIEIGLDRQGAIVSGGAHLSAGAGHFGFPGFISKPVLVDEGQLNLRFEAETGDVILIDSAIHVGRTEVPLVGRFTPVLQDGLLKALSFAVVSPQIRVAGIGERPIDILDSFTVKGIADVVERRIDITQFDLASGAARITAAGRITEGERAPGLAIIGRVSELPIPLLKNIWPPLAARGAREWVIENVDHGRIVSGDVRIDLTGDALADALDDKPIPDEQIDVQFRFDGATARYLGELPPLRDGHGRAHLKGDDFVLTMEGGRIDVPEGPPVTIDGGRFHVGELAPKGPDAEIVVEASGATRSFLRVLDGAPLNYMSRFGLDPQTVGGEAKMSARLHLPLLKDLTIDQVTLEGSAQLSDVVMDGALGAAGIDGGTLRLDVTTQSLVGRGDLHIEGVPAAVTWREDFAAGAVDSSTIDIDATLDDAQRARLGIDLSQILSGPVAVNIVARGKGPDVRTAQVRADLGRARLFYSPIGWQYGAPAPAQATFQAVFGGGRVRLEDLRVSGAALDVRGHAEFDLEGALQSLDFPTFRLGNDIDLVLTGERTSGDTIALKVDARSFDVRPLLKSKLGSGSAEPDAGEGARDTVAVDARIATVKAFNEESVRDVTLTLRSRGQVVDQMSARGRLSDGADFALSIRRSEGGARVLRVDAANAGRVLRAADLYSRIRGGNFSLVAMLPDPAASQPLRGEVKLKQFRVTNERVLREIPGADRDRRFQRSLQNNDFAFSSLELPFALSGDTLRIDKAFLKGPAIGASARGVINTRTDAIDLGGTLIPAYELNSIVSHVPLLGDILAGGKGQGVIGVTFAVSGTTERPQIKINPVSALAPGFLRRMFEFGGAGAAEPLKKPKRGGINDLSTYR